jgi:hypothetical protein
MRPCTFDGVGALVVLAAQAGSIEPGAEAETVVLVRNTGAVTDTFHVFVQGDASRWAIVDPPALTLASGHEGPVWIHFRPPRSPDTIPGRVPFNVEVASDHDPDFRARESGELDIGTYSSLAASFVGEAVMGARGVVLEVAVRNTGNRRVQVDVAAESEDAAVGFDVEPAQVDLPPGQPVHVHVRVKPPRRVLPGRKRDRRVTVSVVSDGGALATLRTEYPDDPTLSDELVRSARVLGVLLVLLFIGGVALLRSESTSGTVAVTKGDESEAKLPVAPTTVAPPTTVDATAEAVPSESPPTTPSPRVAALAPPLPKLVFVRVYGPGSRDVIVREAGTRGNELRLRSDGALESDPRLAPGGDHVAFVRERDSTWRVCVIPSVGGEAVCIADTTADATVAWAPDGRSLYFSRGGSLFSVPYDTSTQTVGPEADLGLAVPGGHFGLSPDGGRVVVVDGTRLQVRALDGSSTVTVNVSSSPVDPTFSPDGSRLLYASEFHVFTVPAKGGQVHQLSAPGTVNGEPTWTGDGDWVVFRSNRSGAGDLYAVKGNGGNGEETGLAQVTSSAEREITPSF